MHARDIFLFPYSINHCFCTKALARKRNIWRDDHQVEPEREKKIFFKKKERKLPCRVELIQPEPVHSLK